MIFIKWGHRACFRPISHFYRQRKLTYRLTSGWKPWSSWSKCSKNCDGGKQTRTRACSVKECDGRTRQTRSCNTYECDGRLFLSYTTQKQEPTTSEQAFHVAKYKTREYPGQRSYSLIVYGVVLGCLQGLCNFFTLLTEIKSLSSCCLSRAF